jgi:hypothetical protein
MSETSSFSDFLTGIRSGGSPGSEVLRCYEPAIRLAVGSLEGDEEAADDP